jgi:putative flavoprotein involved in K+ transport
VERVDVLVVGAGAAGVGVSIALKMVGLQVGLVDRYGVGASFRRWPRETRFITPSFTSNAFNLPDLNALTPDTSPAYSLGKERLSGMDYARYLAALVRHYGLPVASKTNVQEIEALDEGFRVQTSQGLIEARFVVWAVGEFQFPRATLKGAKHGLHYGRVRSWAELEGEERLVIGGYESGIDAAYNLAMAGKKVVIVDPAAPWESNTGEPSVDLSPYTRERLEAALQTGRLKLSRLKVEGLRAIDDHYEVTHRDGRFRVAHPPILATGFGNGMEKVKDLFAFDGDKPLLTEQDESTLTPGLFLAGPKVSHLNTAFCFIYKFRARFPVVAQALARRMGLDEGALELYRKRGMWADDLAACCTSRCAC